MNKSLNILLVDDEPDFLETTIKRLSRRGYSAQSATDCDTALGILESSWPDVVILDVMLPGKDGIQCLREIKQKWPATIVILLTGHASMDAGQKGLEYGASDYCLKPIELDELIEKIAVACKESAGERARTYRKILAPYDGTISTESTLRMACRIARWNDSHVLVAVPFFAKGGEGEEDDINRGLKLIGRQEQVAMDVLFQDGRPSDTIIDISRKKENDLIVMGRAEMSALEKFVISSITGRIIGYARSDVIVLPENSVLRWKRILLCVDGTPYSHAAVNNAIAYARHFKATLHAVHVMGPMDEGRATLSGAAEESGEKRAADVLAEVATKAKESDVVVNPLVREGDSWRQILAAAEDTMAEVIIMGSHERVRIANLLLGSVARKVAMNADCPVFIVKP